MVPDDYITYFATMAAVGGTLVGLVFIAVSILPEQTINKNAPLERQAKTASAFTALLNPLIIALFALIPHSSVGYTALVLGAVDLLTNIITGIYLLRQRSAILETLRKGTFVIGGFVLYILQVVEGIRLVVQPNNIDALETLAVLLIVIYIFGVSRAWDVLGTRQFHLTNYVSDMISKAEEGRGHEETIRQK
jgi:uncharacterized membrane protein